MRVWRKSYKAFRHVKLKGAKRHLLRKSNICALCGKPIEDMKEASIDHIRPLSKGGDDNIHNLQIAHIKCNNEKGDNWPCEPVP